jgi:hypothetical protein
MKKILLSMIAAALITLTIGSCGSKDDPKGVAQNFLNALTKMDYKGAKKYGTPETGKMLDMLESFSSMMPDSIKNKAKEVTVEIKDVKVNGESCDVTYRTNDKDEDQNLNLIKKDGKWLVNMSKDDSVLGEETPVEEPSIEDTTQAISDPNMKDSAELK